MLGNFCFFEQIPYFAENNRLVPLCSAAPCGCYLKVYRKMIVILIGLLANYFMLLAWFLIQRGGLFLVSTEKPL